jgi:hypothetical protein
MVDLAEFKRFFLFNLIGSLIISALVAVITVLIGEFNETSGKVLGTLAMVVIHSLVSLSFIWNDEKQKTFERLSFFSNVLFIIIVLSFITSIFGIWNIVGGEIVGKIYLTFAVMGFASLHGDILSKALNKEGYIDLVVYLNYLFMVLVVLLILPAIYAENAIRSFGEFYFRGLGAAAIVDGTLSVLTIIFYKIYMNKHPKEDSPLINEYSQLQQSQKTEKKGLNPWVWVLIIFLLVQILFVLVRFVFSMMMF